MDADMAVTLDSTRFGTREVSEDALIEFPCGLIGLPSTRYALLAAGENAALLWLHSMDDAGLAIPVTNPLWFFDAYRIELSDDEAARTGITTAADTSVYVTVRPAGTLEQFSANLRAPLLVAGGRGHQVINQSPDARWTGTLASFDPAFPRRNPCSSSPGVPARRSCSATTSSSR
jgi:flagellar assembly factor FliW